MLYYLSYQKKKKKKTYLKMEFCILLVYNLGTSVFKKLYG